MEDKDIDAIVQFCTADPLVIQNWINFCHKLHMSADIIKTLEVSLSCGTSTYDSIFRKVLTIWQSKEGQEVANMEALIQIVKDMGFGSLQEKLIRLKSEKPDMQTPAQPSFSTFIGREDYLRRLEEYAVTKDENAILICGLGGTGKTSLANQFAEIYTSRENATCSWLNGSNLRTSLISENNRITNKAKRDVDAGSTPLLFTSMLKTTVNPTRPWLIVIDALEDENADANFIINTIKGRNALVIVTSKRKKAVTTDKILELSTLSDKDAEVYLETKLKDRGETLDNIKRLYKKVQKLPLALELAVAYIKYQQNHSIKGFKYNIRNYLVECEKTPAIILDGHSSIEDDNYSRTVRNTLSDSIQRVQEHIKLKIPDTQYGYRILQIIAYFNHTDITVAFMAKVFTAMDDDFNWKDFKSCLLQLKDFSLVTVENEIISINQLVQEIVRDIIKQNWTKQNGTDRGDHQFLDQFIRLFDTIKVNELKPNDIRHLISLWNHNISNTKLIQNGSKLPKKLCDQLMELSLYSEALVYAKQTTALFSQKFDNLVDTCTKLDMEKTLARVQLALGETREALQRLNSVCAKQEINSGKNSIELSNTKHEIATVHCELDEFDISLQLFEEALLKRIETYGPTHLETMKTRHNIASVNKRLGNYDGAMCEYFHVLDHLVNEMGESHPDTLVVLHSIGHCYFKLDMFQEAAELFIAILEERIDRQEDMNDKTLITKYMLGLTFEALKRHDEALKLLRETYAAQCKTIGKSSGDTKKTIAKIKDIESILKQKRPLDLPFLRPQSYEGFSSPTNTAPATPVTPTINYRAGIRLPAGNPLYRTEDLTRMKLEIKRQSQKLADLEVQYYEAKLAKIQRRRLDNVTE